MTLLLNKQIMENLDYIREQNRWKPETPEQKEGVPQSSLPKNIIILMLCLAGFFDAIQALLSFFAIGVVISPFISIFAGITFWFWFSVYGISFFDWKRFGALLGGGVAELIPVVDMLPFWIGAVWYIIGTTKIKEVASTIPGGKTLINTLRK